MQSLQMDDYFLTNFVDENDYAQLPNQIIDATVSNTGRKGHLYPEMLFRENC